VEINLFYNQTENFQRHRWFTTSASMHIGIIFSQTEQMIQYRQLNSSVDVNDVSRERIEDTWKLNLFKSPNSRVNNINVVIPPLDTNESLRLVAVFQFCYQLQEKHQLWYFELQQSLHL
jgi:hypothetical protein